MFSKYLTVIVILSLSGGLPVLAAEKRPVGAELAPREIGRLVRAYPMLRQDNPLAGSVGIVLWGCDYIVGVATITITMPTKADGPMPCKRKVAFGD